MIATLQNRPHQQQHHLSYRAGSAFLIPCSTRINTPRCESTLRTPIFRSALKVEFFRCRHATLLFVPGCRTGSRSRRRAGCVGDWGGGRDGSGDPCTDGIFGSGGIGGITATGGGEGRPVDERCGAKGEDGLDLEEELHARR